MELLWNLERNRTFTGQFSNAQEYVEWSLEETLKWMDRYPHTPMYHSKELLLQVPKAKKGKNVIVHEEGTNTREGMVRKKATDVWGNPNRKFRM